MSNVYRENGYNDREDYLSCIAKDYGLHLEQVVRPLANLLGPNEDFDGLVPALEDEASKRNRTNAAIRTVIKGETARTANQRRAQCRRMDKANR